MSKYNELPDAQTVQQTAEALRKNGFEVTVVQNGNEAKQKALELIPQNAEVMTMTSITLETLGLTAEINESGKYLSVRNKLNAMDRNAQHREMQRLGAAPEYAIGSIHALTLDGKVLIATGTGSQLPAYVYGADHVIWVVGAQKLVPDADAGMKRIFDYILPLETQRARKAYGLPDTFNSYPSKVVVYNREIVPGRIQIILVNEVLGF